MRSLYNVPVTLFCLVTIIVAACSKKEVFRPRVENSVHFPSLSPTSSCAGRPVVNARLVATGSLSTGRFGLMAATAGSKIVFAGGWENTLHSSRVDIYDTITHAWSTAELTVDERDGMAVASVGDKIFFAGGGDDDWIDVTSRVDIYNAATNHWTTAELSQPRNYLAAATIGNKVLFAGGGIWAPIAGGPPVSNWPANANYHVGSTVVDIYDNAVDQWTTASLSEGRFELSGTTVGNKIYFAGGYNNIFTGSTTIDIYDGETNTWATSHLREVKASHAGVASGNKIFWAAGANTPYWSGHALSDQVEIRDITSGATHFNCITPKAMFAVGAKNENIIFFTGRSNAPQNKFDIYNINTDSWTTAILPVTIQGAAMIAVNNTIYVAGGNIDGVVSDKVWRLEF